LAEDSSLHRDPEIAASLEDLFPQQAAQARVDDEEGQVISDHWDDPNFVSMLWRAGLKPKDFSAHTPLKVVLDQVQDRMMQAEQADIEAREQRAAQREAKKAQKAKEKLEKAAAGTDEAARKAAEKLASMAAKETLEQDAESALKTLYRQLARDLHPDREPDETRRAEKTDLMSRVNAANDAKDLLALLEIQMDLLQTSSSTEIDALPEVRVAALAKLLEDQLKSELARTDALMAHLSMQLGRSIASRSSSASIKQALKRERAEMQANVERVEALYAEILTDAGFKEWLKREGKALRSRDAELEEQLANMGVSMEDLVHEQMRRQNKRKRR
jgi:hypothetical protein